MFDNKIFYFVCFNKHLPYKTVFITQCSSFTFILAADNRWQFVYSTFLTQMEWGHFYTCVEWKQFFRVDSTPVTLTSNGFVGGKKLNLGEEVDFTMEILNNLKSRSTHLQWKSARL